MNRRVAYWLCQALGWGTYCAVGVGFAITSVGVAKMRRILILYFIFYVFVIGLTHLLRWVIKRRDWLSLPMRQGAPRIGGAAILTGLIAASEVMGVDTLTGDRSDWTLVAVTSVAGSLTVACLVWALLYVSITATRRALEMRLRLREAELRALEAQVNPHFLFNSLNTIRGMILEDAGVAQDMVTRLANILRYSLQRERDYTVPLDREMAIVADYLAIESIRFDDRLRVRFEIQPAAREARVPSMLVQTLVENAVKHGISPRAGGGEIAIRASIDNGSLAMEVVNSGQISDPKPDATCIGLANARERLRLLYGGRAALKLENRGSETVAAMVSLPV